jgi:hypothetical protein
LGVKEIVARDFRLPSPYLIILRKFPCFYGKQAIKKELYRKPSLYHHAIHPVNHSEGSHVPNVSREFDHIVKK